MRRLYGFRNDRILWSPPVLEVSLWRSVPRKICLLRCNTSFECLACQLMARPMYSVIITELWRTIRRYLNLCSRRSIMRSIIMRSVRRLPRKSYAWVKRTAWPIWQTCSRRCSLPIDVEPYADTSCICFDDIPWVIDRCMGEVFYPLERTRYQVVENKSVIRIKSFHCENSWFTGTV